MSKLPKTLSGFTVIPVAYPHSTHIIYARAHVSKSKNPTFPSDRTLFLVNIPVDATEREISLFFKNCGTVERVVFGQEASDGVQLAEESSDSDDEDGMGSSMDVDAPENEEVRPRKKRKGQKDGKEKPVPPTVVPLPTASLRTLHKTGSTAHVIFLDASSLAKALVAPSKPRSWHASEEPTGLAHYMALYDSRRPPLDAVKAHADTSMDLFEFELAKTKQKSAYRKGEAIVDEDGFTLVTRGGAYGQTLGGGVGVASKTFNASGSSRKKKEPKEKEAFYAFQKAEKQRNALLDLKKNFEADKARVEKLKESRRFKPY
ncbi:ribosomal RNA-processing protein 7-domain-containing protein [Melanogaster broomeanus]|nr:ribosomal RNA-processing protein 7-domain-containing protein [Melanogaster broomeanus]